MSKAQAAATSNRKSSFSAVVLVTTKDTLTFRLHPKQLVAFRSKATEVLYGGAAGGGKSHLSARRRSLGARDRWSAGLSLSPYQQRVREPSAVRGSAGPARPPRGGIFHAPATPKENMVESRRRSCCSSLGPSNK